MKKSLLDLLLKLHLLELPLLDKLPYKQQFCHQYIYTEIKSDNSNLAR